jgi:glucan 1,3-beta-glucosidase
MKMRKAGLNSIRLPVGHWYFTELSHVPVEPYILPSESIFDEFHPITSIIRFAKEAGLYVILDLHTAPGSQNGFDNSGLMNWKRVQIKSRYTMKHAMLFQPSLVNSR